MNIDIFKSTNQFLKYISNMSKKVRQHLKDSYKKDLKTLSKEEFKNKWNNMTNNVEKRKGIEVRTGKTKTTYQAYVLIKNNGNRSTRSFKAHVGTYPTMEEAISARTTYIRNLM